MVAVKEIYDENQGNDRILMECPHGIFDFAYMENDGGNFPSKFEEFNFCYNYTIKNEYYKVKKNIF